MSRELIYREFGIRLASERRRQRLSQEQFAAKVGLSRTSITNIECGRQPIQLHQLYVFAATLRVDVTKLVPNQAALAQVAEQAPADRQARYLAEIDNRLSRTKPRPKGNDHER